MVIYLLFYFLFINFYIMKTYRTQEQWLNICDNANNGNWNDAYTEGEEAGFYAVDLLRFYEEDQSQIDLEDLVYLSEGIQTKRTEKKLNSFISNHLKKED